MLAIARADRVDILGAALLGDLEPLAQRGFRVAALSYDPPAVLEGFAKQRGIPYRLLSDEGSTTIDRFGLRDPAYRPGHYAHGVPQPAIFVLSPNGTVLAKLAEGLPISRPAVSQHLKVLLDAGLVSVRQDGTRRLYQVDPKGVEAMRDYLDRFWDQALADFKVAVEGATTEKDTPTSSEED